MPARSFAVQRPAPDCFLAERIVRFAFPTRIPPFPVTVYRLSCTYVVRPCSQLIGRDIVGTISLELHRDGGNIFLTPREIYGITWRLAGIQGLTRSLVV